MEIAGNYWHPGEGITLLVPLSTTSTSRCLYNTPSTEFRQENNADAMYGAVLGGLGSGSGGGDVFVRPLYASKRRSRGVSVILMAVHRLADDNVCPLYVCETDAAREIIGCAGYPRCQERWLPRSLGLVND